MELSDDTLISAYRSGDNRALRTLINRYIRPLYAFAYRMTGRIEEAEDIVQDTFIKVWRTLSRYRPGGAFRSWIFAIARNTVIDYLRKKRVPVISDFDTESGKNVLTETVIDPETLPEVLLARDERDKLVDTVLDALSPEDREIMLLHYGEDMTFESISTLLKKPLNTVKSRHRRAIIKLQHLFKNESATQ